MCVITTLLLFLNFSSLLTHILFGIKAKINVSVAITIVIVEVVQKNSTIATVIVTNDINMDATAIYKVMDADLYPNATVLARKKKVVTKR